MFDGYLSLGGVEVMNQDLTYTLTELSDCPAGWIRCLPCPGLTSALGETQADLVIQNAPWYDAEDPATHRFYGFYPVGVDGATGSTRTATIREGILDGGVVTGVRRAVREIRVRGVMIAKGEDGLDAGMSWLDAVLDGDTCGSHGTGCGEVDACFFVSCPPERPLDPATGVPIPDAEYDEMIDPLRRRLHGVTAISGPLIMSEFNKNDYFAYEVEFTLAAATPDVFSMSRPLSLTPTSPSVVQDSPFNLTPYPSAELADAADLVVATNYALNPSVETNATGWAGNGGAISGPVPATVTTARVTTISANGVASFQVRLNATAAATNAVGYLQAYQDVSVVGMAAGTRLSFSEWGAVQSLNPSATVQNLRMRIQFYNASNAQVGTETVVEGGSFNGIALSAKSIAIPATATYVRVIVITEIQWSTGADVSLYVDALAVTVP